MLRGSETTTKSRFQGILVQRMMSLKSFQTLLPHPRGCLRRQQTSSSLVRRKHGVVPCAMPTLCSIVAGLFSRSAGLGWFIDAPFVGPCVLNRRTVRLQEVVVWHSPDVEDLRKKLKFRTYACLTIYTLAIAWINICYVATYDTPAIRLERRRGFGVTAKCSWCHISPMSSRLRL